MKVVYTAPNRSHHYKYAITLNAAGFLHAFVSGFPRISPNAKMPELSGKLYRSDFLQTIFLASLKAKFPKKISRFIAYLSKIEQDYACRKFVKDCDIFLFYNGSGLSSSRFGKKRGVISIVEAVNSHVDYQEEILEQEHKNINLIFKPFPINEKKRRLQEYKEADYILLPSDFVKRSFIDKGFPESKLLKVPYGFNKLFKTELPEVVAKDKDDSFTILYVGSISVRKGLRYLIKAFEKLDNPKKKLVIVGPNVNDGALNGLTITPNISFTGVLKGELLEVAYKSADVFCLPSIEEGLALVLGEALSFGLPIIATCNTGADDIITNGVEGFIVPIRSSDDIHEKLELLISNPVVLQQMKTNSFRKSSQLNGWDDTGTNLINTLSKVFNNK